MDPREALRKAAYGNIEIGTDGLAANVLPANADSYRGANNIITPSDIATLTDAEAKFLIDTMVEESTLLKEVRKVVMNRPRVEMPRMFLEDGFGLQSVDGPAAFNPVAGGHPESTEGGQVHAAFNTVVMTSSKLVLPWTVTEEFLEDNPEGGKAEQTIARLMGIRAANDMERLAINGDEAGPADALLSANDGYLARINAQTPAAQILSNNVPFTSDIFNQLLRAMPTKYRRNPRQLRYFVGPNIWSDYTDVVASRQGNMADRFLSEHHGDPTYKGITVRQIPFMPENAGGGLNESTIILCDPRNLIWGVQRDMKMRKTMDGRNAINLDQRYYALHVRADFEVENPEAVTMVQDVLPRVP